MRFLNTWYPERPHPPRGGPFFEGWFFKMVTPDRDRVLAVIPGVSVDEKGDGHAFIQVLDDRHRASYYRFSMNDFRSPADRFEIRIGTNRFTGKAVELDLTDTERSIRGAVAFSGLHPWPVRLFSPGVMGWYAFVPGMECYHGVVSMDHALSGHLVVDGETLDFNGGRGYIEKDWGSAFPRAYVWIQCNHFEHPGIGLMVSVARIPWRGRAFQGFLVGLLKDGILYRWTTYTDARLEGLTITDEIVRLSVADRRSRLEVEAERAGGALLQGPDGRDLRRPIHETLTSRISIRWTSQYKKERVRFQGSGAPAGLDVNGVLEEVVG